MITINNENGTVVYTENALANIVGINVLGVAGVKGLVAKNAADGILKKIQGDVYAKGIIINKEDDQISISIAVSVIHGNKFSEIARNIMSNVKHNVEALTDLKVKTITVMIQEVVEA